MRLKDRVAIVTGGAHGIGEGIVYCLAEEGADIAVVDIDREGAGKVADKVKAMGRRALPVHADVTVEDQVNKTVKDTVDYFGRIDILVNNVGGVSPEMAQEREKYVASHKGNLAFLSYMHFSADMWDQYYRLNLKSHVMMSNAVTPYFIKQGSGRIVNIASISGRIAEPTHLPYSTLKAADISLTWSLSRGLAAHNVTVNCVCPGFVYTPLWERGAAGYMNEMRSAVSEMKEKGQKLSSTLQRFADADARGMTLRDYWLKFFVLPNTPMKREQTAEDMGRAVVFFASDDAKNISGQTLHIDGGQVMR
jgi:3-oxoacyl-[acyl-carrier protein] reductase